MSELRIDKLEDRLGVVLARRDTACDLGELRRAYDTDPVGFIRGPCDGDPWEAQIRIAELVRDHPLVVVRGCNGSGKDWLAARLAVWAGAMGWLVLVTGPTERQVKHVIMGEAYRAWAQAQLPGEFHELAWRPDRADQSGILAFTSSDVNRLTGLHAPKVMAIITEAQGVPAFTFEAMLACLTGEQSRLLVVGNPLSPAGKFFEACRSPNWQSVRVAASDHPNIREQREVIPGSITQQAVDRIAAEYGIGSGIYRARVLGEFPDESDEALCRRSWLEQAAERWGRGELLDVNAPVIIGVDVADHGPDSTVLAIRQGDVLRELVPWRLPDLMQTIGRIQLEAHRVGVKPERAVPVAMGSSVERVAPAKGVLVVDAIGVGAGVVSRLRELGYAANPFNGGWRPRHADRFLNTRAESYWGLREALEQGRVAIPRDDLLWDELTAVRWRASSAGKITLERKDVLADRLGRSPDRADAVSMAMYARAPQHLPPLHYA